MPVAAHRLTGAAFAALAVGLPDTATVAELRRAQLSRHLLMLREIVRAASTTTTMRGYAELAAAEETAPELVRAVLGSPLVGVWAAACLTALDAGTPPADAGVGHLADLADAVTTAARAGAAPGSTTRGSARQLTAEHDGRRLTVALEDADPQRARLGLTPTGRLDDDEVARWQSLLRDAWRLLVTRHPGHSRVIADTLTCVVPVEPEAGARGISATSADAFGAVAISAPADAAALAVGLLHETRHSLLNGMQYLFDLHEQPGGRRYSPWRDDPRPASGLLHGAYAYVGVTDFWRVERHGGDPVAAFEFARWRAAVLTATGDLLGGGTLTPAGTSLVEAMRERVLPWSHEPVEEEIVRLAEGANTDHRLRWRLRNLIVDPAAVTALAAAWRRGDPPGPLPTSAVRAGGRRELESNTRLDLTHRHLRGTAVTGEPGDLAYLQGAPAAASDAYRRKIEGRPDDLAAWAGLGLSCDNAALRERPEVVVALHREIAGQLDPIRSASWLTSV